MKSVVILFFIFFFSISFSFSQEGKPIIKVDTIFSYGNIERNSVGLASIKFYNIGQKPLIISKVNSSCGCTVPSWPKDSIIPGDSNVIQVQYDTKRVGFINKEINIISNANKPDIQIAIRGNVVEIPVISFPQKVIDRSSVPTNR